MSRIRSKGTKIELLVAKALRKHRIKFRRYYRINGTPDFALVSARVAIFCDSAFWHGHRFLKAGNNRHNFRSNKEFWNRKIWRNILRDRRVNRLLKKDGWMVVRLWDFNIERDINRCILKIQKAMEERKKK